MRYRDAGVDVERSDALKERIAELTRSTWSTSVRPLPRGFAGFMAWPESAGGGALVGATMDGVGTKLHLAQAAGRVADAAADLVYHGANDLLVHGARPLAFLDYVAQERLDRETVLAVVEGASRACREVGAALLGGETAEMPDTYRPGVVDVAGCMIGWAEPGLLLDGSRVQAGDRLLGLAASGLHTNGYSLARRVLARSGLGIADALPGGAGESLGDALLAPHRWYGRALQPEIVARRINALAHVTGGGLSGNLDRVLPRGLGAEVAADAWPRPALYRWLLEAGAIPESDARTSFNLGIGMVVAVSPRDVAAVTHALEAAGERVYSIGAVVAGDGGVEWM